MQALMNALGYQFRNQALLRQALTHPSMGKEDNQRLEFLGDAVLQYIMSDLLYQSHPADQEGSLTHLRALLVCEAALSQVARGLGIGQALRMDRGEELTGGRDKPSVLCDAMEAVLAAVYLDGGMEAARSFILPFITEGKTAEEDYKTRLQEVVQKNPEDKLSYAVTGESGPAHDKRFEVTVLLNGSAMAAGTGRSKKAAEQQAAKAALRKLNQL